MPTGLSNTAKTLMRRAKHAASLAKIDGLIQACNSDFPEFGPLEEFRKMLKSLVDEVEDDLEKLDALAAGDTDDNE